MVRNILTSHEARQLITNKAVELGYQLGKKDDIVFYMKDGFVYGYTVGLYEPIEFSRVNRLSFKLIRLFDKLMYPINKIKSFT